MDFLFVIYIKEGGWNPMKVSETELKFLAVISERVDRFLKSKNKTLANDSDFVKTIERCLPHLTPGMEFDVYFVNVDSSHNPFILGIYPDVTELETKSATLMQYMMDGKTNDFLKEWASIKNWHIEIDSNILTKGHPLCVDDGDQFVAMLCHEVGHAMSENPLNLMRNYVYSKKTATKLEDMLISKNILVRKFALPMFVHTLQFKIILKRPDDLKDELAADHYVPDEYRGALISYMENHVINSPDYSSIVVNEKEFDNEQLTSIKFSKEAVGMMKRRREVLRNSMKAQYASGDSKYMKSLVKRIGDVAMGYNVDTDETNTVYESSMLLVLESDFAECEKKIESTMEASDVTMRDISILQVQVDDIKTVDQKLFIVHTIYDYLEILQSNKEKILKKTPNADVANKLVATIDDKTKTLNSILDKVMKIDVSNVGDRYGIFIKYPKGYEG